MRVGTKLKNGAEVLAFKDDGNHKTVLAKWGGSHQFVTWRVDDDRNAWLGHYHGNLVDATTDYINR